MPFFRCGCCDCRPWDGQGCPGGLLVSGGDTSNNYWFREGVSMLDTMTRDFEGCWTTEDVVYAIERNETARVDLKRITQCLTLLYLADTVARLPTGNEGDELGRQLNNVDILPQYSLKLNG